MAYISTEQVQKMRKAIKEIAPGWKISLTRRDYSVVNMVVRSAPINLLDDKWKGRQVISYKSREFDELPGIETLRKVEDILNKGNHNNSDSMTDYFDVGWYVYMSVGSWDRHFEVK